MDAFGELRTMEKKINNKGIAVIFLAISIIALCALVGLAVDIGYMYVAKGQLQNAADAAALAGIRALNQNPSDTTQTNARSAAFSLASSNRAAGLPVILASDSTNTYSPIDQDGGNDITVGHWDGSTSTYTPGGGGLSINAVQVRARRTVPNDASRQKQVGIFFAKVIGWQKMGAAATATAAIPFRATGYLALCVTACPTFVSMTSALPSPRVLETGPAATAPATNLFALTTLLDDPTAPGFNLDSLVCQTSPNAFVCNKQIYSTMGADTSTLRNIESVFYDPNFDSANKDYFDSAKTQVKSWTLIVPITDTCPPGQQGGSYDPKTVSQYAKIRLIAVCATGIGKTCRPFSAPAGACSSYVNNVIVIDQIICVPCPSESLFSGLKPALVLDRNVGY
jgi:Flp pilus assembly protein TadG